MKIKSLIGLRCAFALACLVFSLAFVGQTAFAQSQQTGDLFSLGAQAPSRVYRTCLQPVRNTETGVETSLAWGNSGEFLEFDNPYFKSGFGLYELVSDSYFGFKGESAGTGNSRVKGYSRNVEVLNACNTLRRETIKCSECDYHTGDQTGGFLNIRGLEVVRTFEKRSGGWAIICDPTDKFRIDYFGLSKWPDADPSNRTGYSAHDGGIWQKFPTSSDEFRKSDLHCPIVLNTGTVVELDWNSVLTGDLQYAVFRIRNDASTTGRPGDVADWFALWTKLW